MFETSNILFSNTYCMEGWGKGIVIRTGSKTLLGQIKHVTKKNVRKFS